MRDQIGQLGGAFDGIAAQSNTEHEQTIEGRLEPKLSQIDAKAHALGDHFIEIDSPAKRVGDLQIRTVGFDLFVIAGAGIRTHLQVGGYRFTQEHEHLLLIAKAKQHQPIGQQPRTRAPRPDILGKR